MALALKLFASVCGAQVSEGSTSEETKCAAMGLVTGKAYVILTFTLWLTYTLIITRPDLSIALCSINDRKDN